jgi:hypothetical protein
MVSAFGSIPLTVWLAVRKEMRNRELAHVERIKALEVGLPLPDAEVAQAEAERARARWSGLVGIFLPLGMMLVALGTTVVLLYLAGGAVQIVGLCVVWGVAGLVGMFAAIGSLTNLERPKQPEAKDKEQAADPGRAQPPSGAILEQHVRERYRRREDN